MQSITRDALFAAWETAAEPEDMPPVLCATRRLADALVRDYARRRAASGNRAWPAPDCQSWRAWLVQRFERQALDAPGDVPPRLLTEAETQALWHAVVEQATRERPLLHTGRMARLAAQAWQTAHDYHIALPLDIPDDEDAAAFDAWAREIAARLKRLHAMTPAQLPEHLCRTMADAPQRLVLAALDRPTPAQRAMLDALQAAGAELLALDTGTGGAAVRHQVCTDAFAELDVTAHAVLAHARAEPEARIGVVVPDLERRLEPLRRRFDAVLCPWLEPGNNPALRPYSISKGEPLATQPVVAAALDWLDWATAADGAPITVASRCLLSPYRRDGHTGADEERRLRDRGYERVAYRGEAPLAAGRALPSDWAQRFAATLHAVGWPGSPDSAEYQAQRAWNEVLAALGRLDAITGPLPARAALGRLRDLLGEQDFQPQGGETRVQVLGLLEAAGLTFDALYVLGMDETAWPQEAQPAPLLPEALQRRAGVPQATAAGQLERARHITGGLLRAAQTVIFSWAAVIDEQPAGPSPLVPATGDSDAPSPLPARHAPAWQTQLGGTDETWQDDTALPPPAGVPLRGGVRRLGEHAECPFRAVAHHALAARMPPQPEPAPDAMERGLVAHEIMAAIWRRLRDSDALHALSADAQDALVGECVDACLERWRRRAPHRYGAGVVTVEAQRLRRHAAALLDADRQRAPFAVEWLEGAPPESGDDRRDHDIDLHGLRLRLRPDRVDLVPGVGRIVIDYKTGGAPATATHALNAPQLAVYAGLVQDCAGVAFAILRAGATGYAGVVDNDCAEALPALTPVKRLRKAAREEIGGDDWPAVRRLWDERIAGIAQDIRAGVARVDPLQGVCQRCDLQSLCRIHERDAFALEPNGEEA